LLREYSPIDWWGSTLEVTSALARLRRQRSLTDAQHTAARDRLAALRKTWREIQPSSRLAELVENQLDRHELRAADACRDVKLREAARTVGFAIVEL
jgi:hypothetical protein